MFQIFATDRGYSNNYMPRTPKVCIVSVSAIAKKFKTMFSQIPGMLTP